VVYDLITILVVKSVFEKFGFVFRVLPVNGSGAVVLGNIITQIFQPRYAFAVGFYAVLDCRNVSTAS
jgi:hypothetical protein